MSLLDKLVHYFETTSPEKIQADWEMTVKYDEIGPKINDVFPHFSFNLKSPDPFEFANSKINNNFSPDFKPDFFFKLKKHNANFSCNI